MLGPPPSLPAHFVGRKRGAGAGNWWEQQEPHAAGLVRHYSRARLYRTSVRHRELWRPVEPAGRNGPTATADLRAVARDLLHVLDLLRFGRSRHAVGI